MNPVQPTPHQHSSFAFLPSPYKLLRSFRLPYHNSASIFVLLHACHMFCPPRSSWLRHPNNTNHNASASSIFTSSFLGPNILFSTLFSNTHIVCTSFNVTDQVAHPDKTTGKITAVRYLTSQFLYRTPNGATQCTER